MKGDDSYNPETCFIPGATLDPSQRPYSERCAMAFPFPSIPHICAGHLDHSSASVRLDRINQLDGTKASHGTYDTARSIICANEFSVDLFTVPRHTLRHEGTPENSMVPLPSKLLFGNSNPNTLDKHQSTDFQVNAANEITTVGSKKQKRRPARHPYTETEKSFIMECRTTRRLSWLETEEEFARVFNHRTKAGLQGEWYRTRKFRRKARASGSRPMHDRNKTMGGSPPC